MEDAFMALEVSNSLCMLVLLYESIWSSLVSEWVGWGWGWGGGSGWHSFLNIIIMWTMISVSHLLSWIDKCYSNLSHSWRLVLPPTLLPWQEASATLLMVWYIRAYHVIGSRWSSLYLCFFSQGFYFVENDIFWWFFCSLSGTSMTWWWERRISCMFL